MYARLNHLRWPAVNTAEGIRGARDLLLPAFRQAPGFRGLDVLINRETGEGVGISWWATEADAAAAGEDTALLAALSAFPAVGLTFGLRHTYEVVVRGQGEVNLGSEGVAMARMTDVQREVAEGRLVLLDVRPAAVSERAWRVLVRHVRDRVTYTALAAELRISDHTARQLAAQAAVGLRYPDLADLPSGTRRPLVLGGYTTREAITRASDADLLGLKGMSAARLRAVRAVIPRAE